MVVWVLQGIYYFILLNVIVMNVLRRIYHCITWNEIVMNGCMGITKDLPLYYSDC